MEKLKSFVIVVDGKPFIKGFDRGEVPDVRIDFKWKKFKPKRYLKMADITIIEQIALAIEALEQPYTEEQLVNCIDEIINNSAVAKDMAGTIANHPAFPNLSPAQLRAIIRGYSSQIA